MDVYVGAEHRHDDGIPLFRVFLKPVLSDHAMQDLGVFKLEVAPQEVQGLPMPTITKSNIRS